MIALWLVLLASPQAQAQTPQAQAQTPQAQAQAPQAQAQAPQAQVQEDLAGQILNIKRVYVDRLTGGETAAQMRDLIITSLENSKLFVVTENPERADTFLRGAAEDLIYTDDFQSSDSVDMRGGASAGSRDGSYRTGANSSTPASSSSHSINMTAGEHESTNIKERKHEAWPRCAGE
jgi:hypothetical protein